MTTIGIPAPWLAPVAVVGTDGADMVRIRKLGDNLYAVEFNGQTRELSGQQLSALHFDLRGGDDWFIVDDDVQASGVDMREALLDIGQIVRNDGMLR